MTSEGIQRAGETPATAPADVTVVVPCYNHAHYLEECLRSLQGQTLPRWEAIVVDDASPDHDDIEAVIEKVGDERVRLVVHERNKGLGGSRNTGIRAATTEFVLPLDADDKLAPRCLELLVQALAKDEAVDCAYPDCRLFGRANDVIVFPGPPPGRKVLRESDTIPGAGTMMRKRLWERLEGYDEHEALRLGREDFEFYLRAFRAGCRVERVAEPLYLYRIAHSSMNTECMLRDDEVAEYIYSKHKALFDEAGETSRFFCAWYMKAALVSYERGMRRRAFRLAWKAWRLSPSRGRLKMLLRTTIPSSAANWIGRGEHRRFVPFLRYPVRGRERYRPFFVIGVGSRRNGSLGRILASHPLLYLPPKTTFLDECIRKFRRYGGRLSWPDLVALLLAGFEFHPRARALDVQIEPLVNRLRSCPKRDRNLAHVLDASYRHLAGEDGAEPVRWGDWAPVRPGDDVPATLERLLAVFPDARFVHVHDDGGDVVRRHSDRCVELRDEELVARPEEVLRSVCELLGVAVEAGTLAGDAGESGQGEIQARASEARSCRS